MAEEVVETPFQILALSHLQQGPDQFSSDQDHSYQKMKGLKGCNLEIYTSPLKKLAIRTWRSMTLRCSRQANDTSAEDNVTVDHRRPPDMTMKGPNRNAGLQYGRADSHCYGGGDLPRTCIQTPAQLSLEPCAALGSSGDVNVKVVLAKTTEAGVAHSEDFLARLLELFTRQDLYRQVLSLRDTNAQRLLDLLQAVLDSTNELDVAIRRHIIVAMQRLSSSSGHYPASYSLKSIVTSDADFVVSGGFGEIYRKRYKGQVLCVKKLRLIQSSRDELKNLKGVFAKEAILWGQLNHPGILPLYGLSEEGPGPALVSPWMENGDVCNYLQTNPHVNRYLLVADIASGLEYLHDASVIHGDLKGANILIDLSGRARLSDFGISSVFDTSIPHWTTHSTVASTGGTYRWQAPEIFGISTSDDKAIHNTEASDIYSWSCVCYEIFTGNVPFYSTQNSLSVVAQLMKGATPQRPQEDTPPWKLWGLTDDFWEFMESCWSQTPEKRPTARQLVDKMSALQLKDNRPVPPIYMSPSKERSQNSKSPLSITLTTIEGLLQGCLGLKI